MDVPTIAVVGMGGFARQHLRYVAEVEARGLARQVAQVAIPADQQAYARELDDMRQRGIQVYGSLRQMLAAARERICLVCIPTGIHLHAQMTLAAHQAGCHVFVEKPAAGSIQDVDAMLDAGRRAGRLCAVGYQHVYLPQVQLVKKWVSQGRLGAVRQVRAFGCWPRDPAYYARNGWAGRLAVGDVWVLDGPHNNALAHAVNVMLFVGSPVPGQALTPAAVRAELYRANAIESADTAALRVDTVEGPQVFFAVSHCTAGQADPVFVLEGERGRVELGYEGWIRASWSDGTTDRVEAPADTRLPGLLEDVLEAAAGRRPALTCPLELARAQTLCACASFESSAIHPFPPALLRTEGEGGRVVVDGIDEAVRQAGEQGALFSELGLDWAVAGTQIDLAGYTYFPTFRRNVGA